MTSTLTIIQFQEAFLITFLPFIHLIGFICNVICARVFASNKFKHNIYRYLTANSIFDALFLATLIMAPVTQCHTLCKGWLNDYFLKLYKKYGALYVCRALDLVSSLINVAIVIDRYLTISKKKFKHEKFIFVIVMFGFNVFSFILFIPNSMYHDIIKVNQTIIDAFNNTCYEESFITKESELSKNVKLKYFFFTLQYSVSLIGLLIVATFNVLLLYRLKKQINRNNQIIKYSICANQEFKSELDLLKVFKNKASRSSISRSSQMHLSNSEKPKNDTITSDECIRTPMIVSRVAKIQKKSNSNIEKQATMLVFWISVLFIINQIAIQVINTAIVGMKFVSIEYNSIVILYHICAFCFHGANIVIYYFYNQEFAIKLRKIFL